jgi:hypothetical protein
VGGTYDIDQICRDLAEQDGEAMTERKPGLIDPASITPGAVLKWGAVIFAYAMGVLVVISVVLAMFGVYS